MAVAMMCCHIALWGRAIGCMAAGLVCLSSQGWWWLLGKRVVTAGTCGVLAIKEVHLRFPLQEPFLLLTSPIAVSVQRVIYWVAEICCLVWVKSEGNIQSFCSIVLTITTQVYRIADLHIGTNSSSAFLHADVVEGPGPLSFSVDEHCHCGDHNQRNGDNNRNKDGTQDIWQVVRGGCAVITVGNLINPILTAGTGESSSAETRRHGVIL